MKVVVVIDSLKGSLSSIEAGEAAKAGILASNPEAISLQEGKGKNKFPFPLYKGDCQQNSH